MSGPALPDDVAQVVATWPEKARTAFARVRAIAFEETPTEGKLSDGLRWGEPSFVTRPRFGSTVRCSFSQEKPHSIGVFFTCSTGLVDEFRGRFGDELDLLGNREMRLPLEGDWPIDALRSCISRALTYHKGNPLI